MNALSRLPAPLRRHLSIVVPRIDSFDTARG
jgi:hypothetical protein